MPPTCVLALAVGLLTPPGPPAHLEVDFAPVPVPFARPSDTEATPCLQGMLYARDKSGRSSPLAADVHVMLFRPVAGAVPLPGQGEALFLYDVAGLAERVTADDRGRVGYFLRLPWPDGWANDGTVRVKAWAATKGGGLASPEFELLPPKGN
jgi:hypothetical protein